LTAPLGPVTVTAKKFRSPDHSSASTQSGSTTSVADVSGSMICVATIGDR
jgi:hypothetical protein